MPTPNTPKSKTALHTLATNKNIFVGTVDYGEMLFWPKKEEEEKAADRIPVVPAAQMIANYPGCIYSQVMKYCQDNNLEPNEVNVHLALLSCPSPATMPTTTYGASKR